MSNVNATGNGSPTHGHPAPGIDGDQANPHFPPESQLGHVKALASLSQRILSMLQTS